MRRRSKLLFAALGLGLLAGSAPAADRVHLLDVALPDGSVQRIRYLGDKPPRVVLVPVAEAMPFDMFADDGASPFAMLRGLSAMMDAQAEALLRQAAFAPATTARRGSPGGATGYSFTSMSVSGLGGCTRTVQMTSYAPGRAPEVVRRSSGDCSATASRAPTPAAAIAAAAPVTSPLVAARYQPAPAKPVPAPIL